MGKERSDSPKVGVRVGKLMQMSFKKGYAQALEEDSEDLLLALDILDEFSEAAKTALYSGRLDSETEMQLAEVIARHSALSSEYSRDLPTEESEEIEELTEREEAFKEFINLNCPESGECAHENLHCQYLNVPD